MGNTNTKTHKKTKKHDDMLSCCATKNRSQAKVVRLVFHSYPAAEVVAVDGPPTDDEAVEEREDPGGELGEDVGEAGEERPVQLQLQQLQIHPQTMNILDAIVNIRRRNKHAKHDRILCGFYKLNADECNINTIDVKVNFLREEDGDDVGQVGIDELALGVVAAAQSLHRGLAGELPAVLHAGQDGGEQVGQHLG